MDSLIQTLSTSHNRDMASLLRQAGLRPTRQRILLAGLLFGPQKCHVNAESLAQKIAQTGEHMATATIYNCLHQFETAGLLQRVPSGNDAIMFDTNVTQHHHFLIEDTGDLIDIPLSDLQTELPQAPDGYQIDSVDLVVKLKKI